LRVIHDYARVDSRILVISRENRGVVASLNEAIAMANGTYIARMDADDISLPHRISKQVAFMENHPETGIVGCWIRLFGAKDEIWHYREHDNLIRIMLMFRTNGMPHNGILARRDLLKSFPYQSQFEFVEDTDCWVRLALFGNTRFANLQEELVCYRIHPHQVSHRKRELQNVRYERIIHYYLQSLIPALSGWDFSTHMKICENRCVQSEAELVMAGKWMAKLRRRLGHVLPDPHGYFQERWLNFCISNKHLPSVLEIYRQYLFDSRPEFLVKEQLLLK
jgi:glycosyltransferase involved in cell wall biosynthesis